jgi:hypothetical protein
MPESIADKQVNIRVGAAFYRVLETVARQERRSVPQTVRLLLEEGLRRHISGVPYSEDTPGTEVGTLAAAGGSFDWLAQEPDLYDDTCGEPL